MILKVYSVFDVKAAAYARPFFMVNDQSAVRTFGDYVNTQGEPPNLHPEDYSLFCLGEFDDVKGTLVSNNPEIVCTAASLLKVKSEFKFLGKESIGLNGEVVEEARR